MSKDELHAFRRQQIEDYRNSSQSAETWCEANASNTRGRFYCALCWLENLEESEWKNFR